MRCFSETTFKCRRRRDAQLGELNQMNGGIDPSHRSFVASVPVVVGTLLTLITVS